MEGQVDPGRYILGDTLSVLDLYVTVVSRWAGGRARFNEAAPKLAEVARRVDADPRLRDVLGRAVSVRLILPLRGRIYRPCSTKLKPSTPELFTGGGWLGSRSMARVSDGGRGLAGPPGTRRSRSSLAGGLFDHRGDAVAAGEGGALHRLGAQVVEALHAPLPGLPVQHVQVPLVDVAGRKMLTDCDWQMSGVRSAASSTIQRWSISKAVL
jgi:hypothetical protein